MIDRDDEFRTFRGYTLADDEQVLTPSMEDYLEMMFRLTPDRQYVRLGELATALNVQPSSVTRMVQRLADSGYVRHKRYGILELTPLGKETGLRLFERHNLVESFLRLIGVRDNALKDTERIEHIISDEMVERIARFVRHARQDPGWLEGFLADRALGRPKPAE